MIAKVLIDKEKCKGCQYCEIYCPKNCIKMSEELNRHGVNYAVFVNNAACITCGLCVAVCPDVCIEVCKGLGEQVYKMVGGKLTDWFDGNKGEDEIL